jgi:hypothetical protein
MPTAERARAVWTEGEARPRCSCHGEPMVKPSRWRCAVKHRADQARYVTSEKGRAFRARSNPRRIRVRAGGIQFYLGSAPSRDEAMQLRQKIKEEAPT